MKADELRAWDVAQNSRVVKAERPRHRPRRCATGHQITDPRSLRSKNARNSSISGNGCSSAVARSRACERFSSDLKNRRYARFSSRPHVVRKPVALEAHHVQAVELDRVADRLHEGRNVLRDARAAADEAVPSDRRELVHGDEAGEDRLLVDRHVAGELRPIRDDDAVADVTIVGEVHVRHEEAVLPDRRLERLGRSAIDRGVFANGRAVADFDGRVLALVFEILRIAAEHRADADLHARRRAMTLRSRIARGEMTQPSPTMQPSPTIANGADLDVVADLGVADR